MCCDGEAVGRAVTDTGIRLVTHCDVSVKQIEYALEVFGELL